MSTSSRRRIAAALVLLLILLLFLVGFFVRCCKPRTTVPAPTSAPVTNNATASSPSNPSQQPEEKLDPATLKVPPETGAGSVFSVEWTGPGNTGDYVTIVPKNAPDDKYTDYRDIKEGNPLFLTAPVEPGDYEVRYVTLRSKTVLGRTPINVTPVGATINTSAEAVQGTVLSVEWTGPDNKGDYITVVPKDAADGKYENYTNTSAGSPLNLTLPVTPGEVEIRYMTGQGAKVLGRRPLTITTAEVSLSAPSESIAGSEFSVEWKGPANQGDYITVVPKDLPDGKYENYTNTDKKSPLSLTALITPGEAEIRYMSGQGAKVLARRPIKIVAADISLEAPSEAAFKSIVTITWTGPNNKGDYITIVPKDAPDGQYKAYANTSAGSPSTIAAPEVPGPAEIRYMSGQGTKVLKRQAITIR